MNVTFIIIVLLISFNTLFSQEKTGQLEEIKKMYLEAIDLSKKNKECFSGKKIEYEGFDDNSEKFPFEQTVEKCKLQNNYVTITADLKGYEWSSKVNYYYKNNKLFFVLVSNGAEACIVEYRIYLDENEKIIKLIEKSNDCEGGELNNNSEITDASEIDETNQLIEQSKNKIDEILNNK
jgi:hypothetical protein